MLPRILPFAIVLSLILSAAITAHATTWNEPWMDKVIKESDHLVLGRVISSVGPDEAIVQIVKSIAGAPVDGEVKVDGFHMLDLCSVSEGHGPEFLFGPGDTCYLFLKRNDSGSYSIATPTAGFAAVQQGEVIATYRISQHQALISMDLYERTMKAIFNHYHGLPAETDFINEHANRVLALPPAGFTEDQIGVFYQQHVALESIHHLRLSNHYKAILPFLHDTANYHNRISAARALAAYNTNDASRELIAMIADTTEFPLLQVVGIWTLREFKRPELKKDLERIAANASSEYNSFGGRLMDPRICTYVPTVKEALESLIKEL